MKQRILLLMSLLSFSSAMAMNTTVGQVRASYMANMLSQIKSSKDLLKVRLPEKDQKSFKADVESLTRGFKPFKVSMPQRNKVVVTVNNKSIPIVVSDNGLKVSINNKTIEIKKYKTYLNYKTEFAMALQNPKRKNASTLWIDKAYADEGDVGLAIPFAAESTQAGVIYSPDQLEKGAGADDIIAAYEAEAKSYRAMARRQGEQPSLSTMTFTCKGNVLQSVDEKYLVYDGKLDSSKASESLSRNSDGSYSFSEESGCQGARVSADWVVQKSGPSCPSEKSDLSTAAPFFTFPAIAQDCCATSGCPEKVSKALEGIQQRQIESGDKDIAQ